MKGAVNTLAEAAAFGVPACAHRNTMSQGVAIPVHHEEISCFLVRRLQIALNMRQPACPDDRCPQRAHLLEPFVGSYLLTSIMQTIGTSLNSCAILLIPQISKMNMPVHLRGRTALFQCSGTCSTTSGTGTAISLNQKAFCMGSDSVLHGLRHQSSPLTTSGHDLPSHWSRSSSYGGSAREEKSAPPSLSKSLFATGILMFCGACTRNDVTVGRPCVATLGTFITCQYELGTGASRIAVGSF